MIYLTFQRELMAELELDSLFLDVFLCISMYEEEDDDDNDCSQYISDAE